MNFRPSPTVSISAMALVVLVCAVTASNITPKAQVIRYSPKYTDNSMTIDNEMALINNNRAAYKLPALSENKLLDASACDKLDDMVKYNYWEHTSPDGTQPWHWFNMYGYNYQHAGENLAYGQDNAQQLITEWINSPEHKANILDKTYTEQGMCMEYVYFQGQPTWLTVSHFGVQK